MTRGQHTAELRRRALELLGAGRPAAAVARDLGVNRGTIRRWRLTEGAAAPASAARAQVEALPAQVVARLPRGLVIEGQAEDLAAVLAALGFDA